MTPERFEEIVAAYGTASHRWPAAERAAAETFLRDSAKARDMLAREASLDRLLETYRIVPADSALTGAIVASFPTSDRWSWASLLKGLGMVGAGLAGAAVGAFLMTVYAPSVPNFADDDERPVYTSFDVSVGELDLGETQ